MVITRVVVIPISGTNKYVDEGISCNLMSSNHGGLQDIGNLKGVVTQPKSSVVMNMYVHQIH